jgi:DNA-binding MarR family transcriptional regulator
MSSRSDASDHVDRVRAEWRVVRPDIDSSPIAVVARVGRLAAYFDHAINAVMGRYGLTRSTWDILASLRRQPPPHQLSPTELYRALMRSSGWMTNRLHELERAGLIKRVSDPDDRRAVFVRLTRRGVALVDEIAPLHMRNERAPRATIEIGAQTARRPPPLSADPARRNPARPAPATATDSQDPEVATLIRWSAADSSCLLRVYL